MPASHRFGPKRYSILLALGFVVVLGSLLPRAAAQTAPPPAAQEPAIQLMQPPGPAQTAPPVTITLQDALQRAQKNDADFLSAVPDVKSAHDDFIQARADRLPQATYNMAYLNTKGNGRVSDGRFVTNDGVHIYQVWGIVKQELSANTLLGTRTAPRFGGRSSGQCQSGNRVRRGPRCDRDQELLRLGHFTAQIRYRAANRGSGQTFPRNGHHSALFSRAPRSRTTQRYGQSRNSIPAGAAKPLTEAALAMENARLNLARPIVPDSEPEFHRCR